MQVPRTYISKIENGKTIPTLSSLQRLATALEVSVADLVSTESDRSNRKAFQLLENPFWTELAELSKSLDPVQKATSVHYARALSRRASRLQALAAAAN